MLRKEASKTLESLLLRLMAIVAASTPSESEESAEESSDGSVEREAAMEMSPEKYSPFHEVEETQNATVRKYIHSEEEEKEEEKKEEEKKQAGEANESKETNEESNKEESNKEESNKEQSNKEESNKEQSNKEEINKEASDQAISAAPSASRPPTDPNQPLTEPAEPLVEPAEPLVEPVNPSAPSTSSVPLSASLPQSPRSPLPLSASLTRASDSLSPSPPSPFLLQRAPIDLPPSNSISISNPAARWLPVALCSVELLSQAISVPFSPSLSPSQLPIFESATAEDQRRILFSLRPLRKIITAFSALFRGRSGLARILSRSTLASLVMLLYHQQADVAIFSEAMTIFSCVASKLWPFYKKELELFFEKVVFHMLGNIGMYKRMDRFLMERTLLETLLGILEKPNALENLFRNYDCDVYSLNITSILFSIVDSPFLRLTARSARRSSSISRTCFLTIAVSSRSSARRASPRPNRSLPALPTTPICSARFCCSSWTVRSAR